MRSGTAPAPTYDSELGASYQEDDDDHDGQARRPQTRDTTTSGPASDLAELNAALRRGNRVTSPPQSGGVRPASYRRGSSDGKGNKGTPTSAKKQTARTMTSSPTTTRSARTSMNSPTAAANNNNWAPPSSAQASKGDGLFFRPVPQQPAPSGFLSPNEMGAMMMRSSLRQTANDSPTTSTKSASKAKDPSIRTSLLVGSAYNDVAPSPLVKTASAGKKRLSSARAATSKKDLFSRNSPTTTTRQKSASAARSTSQGARLVVKPSSKAAPRRASPVALTAQQRSFQGRRRSSFESFGGADEVKRAAPRNVSAGAKRTSKKPTTDADHQSSSSSALLRRAAHQQAPARSSPVIFASIDDFEEAFEEGPSRSEDWRLHNESSPTASNRPPSRQKGAFPTHLGAETDVFASRSEYVPHHHQKREENNNNELLRRVSSRNLATSEPLFLNADDQQQPPVDAWGTSSKKQQNPYCPPPRLKIQSPTDDDDDDDDDDDGFSLSDADLEASSSSEEEEEESDESSEFSRAMTPEKTPKKQREDQHYDPEADGFTAIGEPTTPCPFKIHVSTVKGGSSTTLLTDLGRTAAYPASEQHKQRRSAASMGDGDFAPGGDAAPTNRWGASRPASAKVGLGRGLFLQRPEPLSAEKPPRRGGQHNRPISATPSHYKSAFSTPSPRSGSTEKKKFFSTAYTEEDDEPKVIFKPARAASASALCSPARAAAAASPPEKQPIFKKAQVDLEPPQPQPAPQRGSRSTPPPQHNNTKKTQPVKNAAPPAEKAWGGVFTIPSKQQEPDEDEDQIVVEEDDDLEVMSGGTTSSLYDDGDFAEDSLLETNLGEEFLSLFAPIYNN